MGDYLEKLRSNVEQEKDDGLDHGQLAWEDWAISGCEWLHMYTNRRLRM